MSRTLRTFAAGLLIWAAASADPILPVVRESPECGWLASGAFVLDTRVPGSVDYAVRESPLCDAISSASFVLDTRVPGGVDYAIRVSPECDAISSAVFFLNTLVPLGVNDEYCGSVVSGGFALNTIGAVPSTAWLRGRVRNAQSGVGLAGVRLELDPGNRVAFSSVGGFYEIAAPANWGYHLAVSAPGYASQLHQNLHLPVGSQVTLDLLLDPVAATYELAELSAATALDVVEVQQGGTAWRHFRVVDSNTGQGVAGVGLTVDGIAASFVSDASGRVAVGVSANQVGGGAIGSTAQFAVATVGGITLPAQDRIAWQVEVTPRPVERTWASREWLKLGASSFNVTGAHGCELSLWENGEGAASGDSLRIGRLARLEGGVEFSIGVSAGVHGDLLEAGAGASAGIGGNLGILTEDQYTFPRTIQDDWQALYMYVLFADGHAGRGDAVLVRVLGALEEWLAGQNQLEAAWRRTGAGLSLSREAEARVGAAIGVREAQLGLRAEASVGAGAGAEWRMSALPQGRVRYSLGLSGELSGGVSGGLFFGHPRFGDDQGSGGQHFQEFPAKLGYDLVRSGSIGCEFAVVFHGWQHESITFANHRRHLDFVWGAAGEEVRTVYTIEGAPQLLDLIRASLPVLSMAASENGELALSSASMGDDLISLLELITDAAGSLTVRYEQERALIEHIADLSLELEIEPGTNALGARLGGGLGFESSRSALVEQGVVVDGHHCPEQSHGTVPAFAASYTALMEEVWREVPLWRRLTLRLLSILLPGLREDWQPIGDTGSAVDLPASCLPDTISQLEVSSWGWYGQSPSTLARDVAPGLREKLASIRERTEQGQGLRYGIGGFHQFEPIGLALLDTARIRLQYQDEECAGFDESELAVFREDKPNADWIHLGGVVDTVANTVTAPFSVLGCYTLAPRLPRGELGMQANPPSLPADSSHTSLLRIGPLWMNDGSLAPAGTKLTVAVDRGRLLASDLDSLQAGLQVAVDSTGHVDLQLLSGLVAYAATVTAQSVLGHAAGSLVVPYLDSSPPPAPVLLSVDPGYRSLSLAWLPVSVPDLAGYRLHFDTDGPEPPFAGKASAWGRDSPVDVGLATHWTLQGLANDSLYFVCVTAIDVAGEESPFSTVLVAQPKLPPVVDLDILQLDGALHLVWSPVPGASGYRVEWSPVPGAEADWQALGQTAMPGWILPGVPEDEVQVFRVIVIE
jgi:hypothetical protein